MANCLVLGGAGFLGSNLSLRLLNSNNYVWLFDRKGANFQYLSESNCNSYEIIEGDFGDYVFDSRLLEKIDVVFHLISTTVPSSSNTDMVYDLTSNLTPTIRLLEAIKSLRQIQIIFISSGGTVYGMHDEIPINENALCSPICSYGIHKLTIEKYLFLFNHLYGLNYKTIRLANPYGIRQNFLRNQGVIPIFLYHALLQKTIEIWGDGSTIRDYIFIDDCVESIIKLANYKGKCSVFNIGSGVGYSLNQIVQYIEKVLNHKVVVDYKPIRSFDLKYNVLDIELARTELNWSPEIDLELGIKKTLNYMMSTLIDSNQI